jgi:hypothetical protein
LSGSEHLEEWEYIGNSGTKDGILQFRCEKRFEHMNI